MEGVASPYAEAMAELRAAVETVALHWREQTNDPVLSALGHALPGMVSALMEGAMAERQALLCGDARAVSQAAQRATQPVAIAFVGAAWQLQGHAVVPALAQRPCCPDCGRRLKLVRSSQSRTLIGRCGPYRLQRPYYTCEHCGGGYSSDDAAWGLGPGDLDPDLQDVLARDGVHGAFQDARDAVWRHLQVSLDDNTAERTTVGIGLVAMEQRERRDGVPTRQLAPDPGSDTMLLTVDGGRVHAGGEWREVKVAAAGPLGPDKAVDPDTGRAHLLTGPLHYAADITDADHFFTCHVRQVAEDAGLFHPRVRSVVLLADGGEWIENRWVTLGLPPSAQVFDILDFRHFQQHVWGAAKACWGESSARTKTWAQKQIDQVLAKGPEPLLKELATIRPRRAQGRQEMRKLHNYVERNAHRLRYPEFIAQELPIGSGAIEAGVRVVNNERLKNSCMHWSVIGARAVLALRAIALSPPRCWEAFCATRPWLARPTARDLIGLRGKAA